MRCGHWTGELQFRHFATNAVIPVLLDGFLIKDPTNGVPINIATVTRDLTAQKRTETELRSLNEELERRVVERTRELKEAQTELIRASRLSAADQMAAALAHELNQPLTAMTNSVNSARRLIVNDGSASPVLLEIIKEATEEAFRAAEVIQRLRNLVDHREMDRRIENLPSLIEEASALALAGWHGPGVEVRLHTSQDAVQVLADPIQIQQVLVTLIRNGLAAIHNREQRELEIKTTLLDHETVEVTIADAGRGWSDEARDHLFEPLISVSQEGMGLGLSICRSIIERHGGSIRSHPNPDGGRTFSFTLTAVTKGGAAGDG
jgi:C4-dicarboxylate-specific signal transduction histidine kinase